MQELEEIVIRAGRFGQVITRIRLFCMKNLLVRSYLRLILQFEENVSILGLYRVAYLLIGEADDRNFRSTIRSRNGA